MDTVLPHATSKFHEFISRRKSFLSNTKIGSRKRWSFLMKSATSMLCLLWTVMFNEVENARVLQQTILLKIKAKQAALTLWSVFSFPVGGEPLNCTNYQSLWLEAIGFLPATENVKKQVCLWRDLICDDSSWF